MTQPVPLLKKPIDAWLRLCAGAVNNMLQGHLNNTLLNQSLAVSASSTTITDPRISLNTVVVAMPLTADATGALATMAFACTNGAMTITHANNTQADRTFNFAFLG